MGNFAENLNLGNRFRPPPPLQISLKDVLLATHLMVSYCVFCSQK